MTEPTFQRTVQELYRLIVQRKAPNGHAPEEFGPYAELIQQLHETYVATADVAELLRANGKADQAQNPADAVRQVWDLYCRQPDYQPFAEALQQAQLTHPDADLEISLDWLEDQLVLIPRGLDAVELRRLLEPTLQRLIALDDEPIVMACLERMRQFFQWKYDAYRPYRDLVIKRRKAREKAAPGNRRCPGR